MNSVDFPYSPADSLILILWAPIMVAMGSVLIWTALPVAVVLGSISVAIGAWCIWASVTRPRSVQVNLATGLATFKPPRWLNQSSPRTISIHDFSAIFATSKGSDGSCSVALSNHRGEWVTLLFCVDASEAQRACELLSNHFGLTNRGFL